MKGLIYYKKPHRFYDERGFFQEMYNGSRMGESTDDPSSLPSSMVQVNHSHSKRGVLRGMHWQQPNPVGKYVTCVHGLIWDVVVDIRRSSPTFKQWKSYEISSQKGQALWVPPGFAHGFLAISLAADVLYMQSAPFNPSGDRVLRWDDPDVAIDWPHMAKEYIISEKDSNAPRLSDLSEEVLFN